ncbi:MAG: thiamine diphosphokinase [Calditrichaeota bacterium]|nr:thiamine diphosphokinase [Calditrichota bacterium]
MEKIVAIVLNGEGLHKRRLKQALRDVSAVIAADGGANYCRKNNVIPDYIIGDLDSISIDHTQISPETELIRIDDQYSTDLEKALKLADTLKPDRLRLLNATGKRSDHAVANILFLARKSERIPVEVFDNYGVIHFLNPGRHQFYFKTGKLISLTSFTSVKNLSLKGFKYSLSNEHFNDFFVGISNVVVQEPCEIAFDSGILMMYEVERIE